MRIVLIFQYCLFYQICFIINNGLFFFHPCFSDSSFRREIGVIFLFFKLFDTLFVSYTEFKQCFFYLLLLLLSILSSWLLLQWKRSAFVSIKYSKIAACCPAITVLLASPAFSVMESPAAIACLLTRVPSRYLLKFCQTSSLVCDLLRI